VFLPIYFSGVLPSDGRTSKLQKNPDHDVARRLAKRKGRS
jgi:hypothetical protein